MEEVPELLLTKCSKSHSEMKLFRRGTSSCSRRAKSYLNIQQGLLGLRILKLRVLLQVQHVVECKSLSCHNLALLTKQSMATLHTKVWKLKVLNNLIVIIIQNFNLTLKGWSNYMQIPFVTTQKLNRKETHI